MSNMYCGECLANAVIKNEIRPYSQIGGTDNRKFNYNGECAKCGNKNETVFEHQDMDTLLEIFKKVGKNIFEIINPKNINIENFQFSLTHKSYCTKKLNTEIVLVEVSQFIYPPD